MIGIEKREEIKEALRYMTVSQVATQFKVSRNVVHGVKNGLTPKKGLDWEAKRKRIAEDVKTMTTKELAEKYGVSRNRIYDILKKERG